jgi:DNA-binding FadR family transcriptional regulator
MHSSSAARSVRPRGRPVRHPILAEVVADKLRQQIISGETVDALPRQEDLILEFGVSAASIREALRILQAEGLIAVKRGSVGGAAVRPPSLDKVAYLLAMHLEAAAVPVEAVVHAVRQLDPVCAAECARREDRRVTVIPKLRRIVEDSRKVIDQPVEYAALARRFHQELVLGCGNKPMSAIVGVLEILWTAHMNTLTRRPEGHGLLESREARIASLDEHVAMIQSIAAGDPHAAGLVAREHLNEIGRTNLLGQHLFVSAGFVRDAAVDPYSPEP